jgi:hypothetical protein
MSYCCKSTRKCTHGSAYARTAFAPASSSVCRCSPKFKAQTKPAQQHAPHPLQWRQSLLLSHLSSTPWFLQAAAAHISSISCTAHGKHSHKDISTACTPNIDAVLCWSCSLQPG